MYVYKVNSLQSFFFWPDYTAVKDIPLLNFTKTQLSFKKITLNTYCKPTFILMQENFCEVHESLVAKIYLAANQSLSYGFK